MRYLCFAILASRSAQTACLAGAVLHCILKVQALVIGVYARVIYLRLQACCFAHPAITHFKCIFAGLTQHQERGKNAIKALRKQKALFALEVPIHLR